MRVAPVLVSAALGVACSGEVDPLEEAIEVRDRDLANLVIEPPSDTRTSPLRLNPGDRRQLSLRGVNGDGNDIDIRSVGRAWRVSDPSLATIDANGELLALADGDFTVDVRIGDVDTADVRTGGVDVGSFAVSVLELPLRSVGEIDGPDTIDPCVVERYVAFGEFGRTGESSELRLLTDVTWRIEDAGAEPRPQGDGSVLLSVDRPDATVILVASPGEEGGGEGSDDRDLPKEIVVGAAPTSLTIGPEGALTSAVGATTDLVATAVYAGDGDMTRREIVTDAVDWQVVSGAEFVTIGNDPDEPGTRGQVTAVRDGGSGANGTASIRAVCGDVDSEQRDFVVSASSTSGSSSDGDADLSFDGAENPRGQGDGGDLDVFVGRQVQLRVSTGSTYDEGEDVTSAATWSLRNDEDSVFGTVSATGLFIPNAVGTVEVRAEYRGAVSILTVNVN